MSVGSVAATDDGAVAAASVPADITIRLVRTEEYQRAGEVTAQAYLSSYGKLSDEYVASLRDVASRVRGGDVWVAVEPSGETRADIVRILSLWAEARARFGKGGPFLFGSFGAADIIYAPVVSRFITYGVPVPGFAVAYMQAVWEHDWMQAWVAAAEAEEWTIEKFEQPQPA